MARWDRRRPNWRRWPTHHDMAEQSVIDVAVPVDVGLPHDLIHLLVREVLPEVRHDMPQLRDADPPGAVFVEHPKCLQNLLLGIGVFHFPTHHREKFRKVNHTNTIRIDLVDHVCDLCVGRVLTQTAQQELQVGGVDGARRAGGHGGAVCAHLPLRARDGGRRVHCHETRARTRKLQARGQCHSALLGRRTLCFGESARLAALQGIANQETAGCRMQVAAGGRDRDRQADRRRAPAWQSDGNGDVQRRLGADDRCARSQERCNHDAFAVQERSAAIIARQTRREGILGLGAVRPSDAKHTRRGWLQRSAQLPDHLCFQPFRTGDEFGGAAARLGQTLDEAVRHAAAEAHREYRRAVRMLASERQDARGVAHFAVGEHDEPPLGAR
mmetsp:Transcript_58117/g.168710  ORF Transcript_58117/g.168710 Transcript_58117/m.168710 type:complete len:385 (+) Transcript_58117:640-1794(+)